MKGETRLHIVTTAVAAMLFVAAPVLAGPGDRADIGGIWMPTVFAPDGTRNERFPDPIPYLPEIAADIEEFRANYDPLVDDTARSCIPYGMPQQMLGRAQYPMEIIETDGQVTILTELHNDVRRIYLDGRSRPAGLLPTWMGFSTGNWQDGELVVETSNIREHGYPRPQSLQLVITEHLRIVDGGDAGPMLELEMTIDDPGVYTQPLTVRNYFRRYPNLEMGEYFCSEDLWRQNLDGRSDDIPWR